MTDKKTDNILRTSKPLDLRNWEDAKGWLDTIVLPNWLSLKDLFLLPSSMVENAHSFVLGKLGEAGRLGAIQNAKEYFDQFPGNRQPRGLANEPKMGFDDFKTYIGLSWKIVKACPEIQDEETLNEMIEEAGRSTYAQKTWTDWVKSVKALSK